MFRIAVNELLDKGIVPYWIVYRVPGSKAAGVGVGRRRGGGKERRGEKRTGEEGGREEERTLPDGLLDGKL